MSSNLARTALSALVGVAVCLAAAGCGSSTPSKAPTSESSSKSSSESSSVSVAPRTSSSPTPSAAPASTRSAQPVRYTPPKSCLFSVSQVSSVLGGTWKRSDGGAGKCSYSSDRGAIFAIQPIPAPPSEQQAALADARVHNCGGRKPRDVPGSGGAFVCVESSASGDLVEGNLIAKDHFWLIVAVGAGSDKSYTAQSDAIAALLRLR